MVLFRAAVATVPEVATARVRTLRPRLWKVGAVLERQRRRVVRPVSATWPYQELWRRGAATVASFVNRLRLPSGVPRSARAGLPR